MSRSIKNSEKRNINKLILNIASDLSLHLSNPETIKSRYDYNKYIFTYISLFGEQKSEIIVETSFYQEVYPIVKRKVESFIATFCRKKKIELPISFEASSFYFNVQSLERTFIDKVFAVFDYKLQNMANRDSRHLYDIAKITPHITFDNNLKKLIKK